MQKLKAVCANTPASHTPLPHQVVPLEHFCVGRSSCCTVALTPKSLSSPEAQTLWCNSDAASTPKEQLCLLQGRVWSQEQRLLQTPDLVALRFLISFKMLLLSVCLFACLFFSFYEKFSSRLPFIFLVRIKLTY